MGNSCEYSSSHASTNTSMTENINGELVNIFHTSIVIIYTTLKNFSLIYFIINPILQQYDEKEEECNIEVCEDTSDVDLVAGEVRK